MRIAYDGQADTLSFVLTAEEAVTSRELTPGLIITLNSHGGIVGIDVLGARAVVGRAALSEIAIDLRELSGGNG